MSLRNIQTIGTVIKKEKLASVENATNSQYLILESLQPFPGYHGTTIPDQLDPDSLFAVTRIMYNDERIIRAVQAVKKQYPISFNATPGTISVQNKPVNVIRFKSISYQAIAEIIEHFKEAGIEFQRSKKIAPYESIIRIRKHFSMQEINEHIFRDVDSPETYYIEVPVQMRWNTFEKVTMHLKYNIEDYKFDAAQTNVFTEDGIMDLVRIYDLECNLKKLQFIREKYLEEIHV